MVIETSDGVRVQVLDGATALYDSADRQVAGTLHFEQIVAEVDQPLRYLADGVWQEAPFGTVLNTLIFHLTPPGRQDG